MSRRTRDCQEQSKSSKSFALDTTYYVHSSFVLWEYLTSFRLVSFEQCRRLLIVVSHWRGTTQPRDWATREQEDPSPSRTMAIDELITTTEDERE